MSWIQHSHYCQCDVYAKCLASLWVCVICFVDVTLSTGDGKGHDSITDWAEGRGSLLLLKYVVAAVPCLRRLQSLQSWTCFGCDSCSTAYFTSLITKTQGGIFTSSHKNMQEGFTFTTSWITSSTAGDSVLHLSLKSIKSITTFTINQTPVTSCISIILY